MPSKLKRCKQSNTESPESGTWKKIDIKKYSPEIRTVQHFYMRDIRENVLPKLMYGDTMLVSFWGAHIWQLKTNRNICLWILLINSKLKFYSETRNVYISKSRKLVMLLLNIRAFPAPAKCRFTQKLGNSSILYHKTKNPYYPKICIK